MALSGELGLTIVSLVVGSDAGLAFGDEAVGIAGGADAVDEAGVVVIVLTVTLGGQVDGGLTDGAADVGDIVVVDVLSRADGDKSGEESECLVLHGD